MTNARKANMGISDMEFVKESKKFAKPHIEKIIKKYNDEKLKQLFNDFNGEIIQFDEIEERGKYLIKKILMGAMQKDTFNFNSMRAVIHFIVGSCQLAQSKYIEAQTSFDDGCNVKNG